MRQVTLIAAFVALTACGGNPAGAPDAAPPRPIASEDFSRDILSTALEIDVTTRDAIARIKLAGSTSTGASFEIGDLQILTVTDDIGPLEFRASASQLDVGVPASTEPVSIVVEYRYAVHSEFDGAHPNGFTLLWPYYCGNLFPCKSDPSDGLTFELSLSGIPDGETAVFTNIVDNAPSYMVAWAIGDYTYEILGTTAAGTEVGVYGLPGDALAIAQGTPNLVEAMQWYETNLGAYIFGDKVASVSVAWGGGAFGGMEHHPLWHLGSSAMADESTHAHEAAHGWFGNGIRIACWEDFVLSEGTVSYLTARALTDVGGAQLGFNIWQDYSSQLDNEIAWPTGCNEIDILNDGLFGAAPYVKGAYFYRAVENKVGTAELDAALKAFYTEYVGKAARMQDMLDTILAETGYDATTCADMWLRSQAVPTETTCP